jgi:hypothetical protein
MRELLHCMIWGALAAGLVTFLGFQSFNAAGEGGDHSNPLSWLILLMLRVVWSWPYGETSGWIVAGLLQWSVCVLLAFGVRAILRKMGFGRGDPTAEGE